MNELRTFSFPWYVRSTGTPPLYSVVDANFQRVCDCESMQECELVIARETNRSVGIKAEWRGDFENFGPKLFNR